MATPTKGHMVSVLSALVALVAAGILWAEPVLAATCAYGGEPAQYYCASTSWSYDAGGWTNVAATINEASSSDGFSLGQGVAYNWAGIYQNEDAAGWVIVSAHLCPNTVSCSTFFSTQALVGSDRFMWVVFAASAPGQVIPGSYQYGRF